MKFLPLIWAGLWRKPARTILTILSITIAFVLFGVLASFGAGYAHFVGTLHLDRLNVDPRFTGQLPSSYVEQIEKLDGVTLVAPVLFFLGNYQDPKNGMVIIASNSRWFKARPEVNATDQDIAALINLRTGVIVTRQLAAKYHFKVGDKVPLQSRMAQNNGSTNWTFDVVAIVDGLPGDSRGFMIGNYAYFDQARSTDMGTFSHFIVRIGDPERATETSKTIDAKFANSAAPTRTISDRASQDATARQGLDINYFIQAVIGATLFMLLFLTGNVMKQSVQERIPELAVLKTIGYRGELICVFVLAESLFQSAVGAILGLGIAKLIFVLTVNFLMKTVSPTIFPIASIISDQVSVPVVLTGVAVAAGVAMASALLPALRAQRIRIVDALAGR